jgi:predicted RNA-binding Zn ribbon-like protein
MHFDGVRPEPGGRAPAPGALRLVQRFVNSVDLEDGPDDLATPQALREWLTAFDLLDDETISAQDHARALALREAIRDLAGGDSHAAAVVNEAARRAALHPVFAGGGSRLEPAATGVDAALGRIVAAIHTAVAEGTWERLKACDRDSCRWAFYDHSKNQSSHWCSTAGCGAREKNRRAYRRRRAAERRSDAASRGSG